MSWASQHFPQKIQRDGDLSESDEDDIECRICHDSKANDVLVSPCHCKGTVGLVHLACLQRWLLESGRSRCELCGARFVMRRELHRTAAKGFLVWWFMPHQLTRPQLQLLGQRPLRNDLLSLGGVALLLVVVTVLCVMLGDFYLTRYTSPSQAAMPPTPQLVAPPPVDPYRPLESRTYPMPRANYVTQVSGHFTATMLMLLVLVSFSCFICWAQMSLRLQANIWYFWWQHDVTVTVVAEPIDKLAYRRSVHLSRRRGNDGSFDTRRALQTTPDASVVIAIARDSPAPPAPSAPTPASQQIASGSTPGVEPGSEAPTAVTVVYIRAPEDRRSEDLSRESKEDTLSYAASHDSLSIVPTSSAHSASTAAASPASVAPASVGSDSALPVAPAAVPEADPDAAPTSDTRSRTP